jgi:hypothetical protein
MEAFAMQAVISAFTTFLGIELTRATNHFTMPPFVHLTLKVIIVALSTFIVLVLMNLAFGYGAPLVDTSSKKHRKMHGSLAD